MSSNTGDVPTSGSNVETEYLEINSKNTWPVLFQYIRNESTNNEYTCDESKKKDNRPFNRYRDVAPYDHSRIILQKKGHPPFDYINANIVRMEQANRQYILTQGPLPNTVGHFWQMVWEQNSKAVIMLNKIIEKNQVKCHQYWPSQIGTEEMAGDDFTIENISEKKSMDYITRTIRLTERETNKSRDILHYHYTTWPDFGVPQSPTAFLRFLADVRQSGALDDNVGPAIVHCSAGIGRSGTFCLVDTCLVLIEQNGLNSVNVRDVLLEMRKYRMGLIQTAEQLRFSYAAIIEGSKHLPLTDLINDSNDIVTNHYDIMNNINNSSLDDDDDEAPPLPPPRGESLTRSMMSDTVSSHIIENANNVSSPPCKPLPSVPSGGVNSNSNNSANHLNDSNNSAADLSNHSTSDGENSFQTNSPPSSPDSKNDLRRRRMEKKEKLDAQVRDMKRRQKETEDWQNFKRSKNESSEQASENIQEERESSS